MRVIVLLKFLGPFQALEASGEPLHLPNRKAQALLALLALEPNGTSRERAAGLLWGDLPQERARHNVRQTLSKIRSVCGDIVLSQGDILQLDADSCSSDISEFQRSALLRDEPSLEKALDLSRGSFLAGLVPREHLFEEWLEAARAEWEQNVCRVLDRLVQLLVERSEYEQALEKLLDRLKLDPSCEPAHRCVMEIYAKTGRRSDALRQFKLCCDALARDLEAEPSPETVTLYHGILKTLPDSEEGRITTAVRAIMTSTSKPTVAVLPFVKLSSEDDYFSDGITEDIITALSRFHSLQVIARNSSFVYKNKQIPDREIASAIGADFLVRGSIQRVGSRVRVSVQLLDGSNELIVWTDRLERDLDDILAIQDEITATIVATLADRVEANQRVRVRNLPGERLAAYDYLLKGKEHHHRFSAEDCAICIDMFDRAVEMDPGFAQAHAWLACGLGQAMVFDLDDHNTLLNRSQAAAELGLSLDDMDAECHRVLAQIHMLRGDLRKALNHQQRALFLNPNDDRSVCAMGELLTFLGRPEEGESWVKKSMQLNPYHPQRYNTHLARALLHQRKFVEAFDRLIEIGRPRQDDLAYLVAAAAYRDDTDLTRLQVETLHLAHPDFDLHAFLATQPYERFEDKEFIRKALVKAGF